MDESHTSYSNPSYYEETAESKAFKTVGVGTASWGRCRAAHAFDFDCRGIRLCCVRRWG